MANFSNSVATFVLSLAAANFAGNVNAAIRANADQVLDQIRTTCIAEGRQATAQERIYAGIALAQQQENRLAEANARFEEEVQRYIDRGYTRDEAIQEMRVEHYRMMENNGFGTRHWAR